MTQFVPLLLAFDIREVIFSGAFLSFLVMWVINKLLEEKKKVGPPPVRGQGGAVGPAGAPRAAGLPPQPVAKPPVGGGLRSEMEEFMRRAALQAQGPGQGQGPANRPAMQSGVPSASRDRVEVLIDDEPPTGERPRPEPLARRLEARTGTPPSAKGPAASPPRTLQRTPLKRETVADHVAQQFSSGVRSVSEQASKLGQRIIDEDRQFDVQLKAKFDRGVGTLAASRLQEAEQKPAESEPSPAAQIAAMLANPDGVRQAILLNEVMRRPADRW